MKRRAMENVRALVLAGGLGERLYELTGHARRAKPAVPFGGRHRLVDFPLSNLINSGVRDSLVLTQTKHHSLIKHVAKFWGHRGAIPVGGDYFSTANSVYQNLDYFEGEKVTDVIILPADQISLFDAAAMYEVHKDSGADLTICLDVVSTEDAKGFGVAVVDGNFRIKKFTEKPDCPEAMPGSTDKCLASMGIYIFTLSFLQQILEEDMLNSESKHDFGKDIIQLALDSGAYVGGYDFTKQVIEGQETSYFRDAGTLPSYHAAHMDLLGFSPVLNTYNKEWPIWGESTNEPWGKKVRPSPRSDEFSLLGHGSINDASCLVYSIAGNDVTITESLIEYSILFPNVKICAGCHLRNMISDKNVVFPPRTWIGFDEKHDIERGFRVVDGITLVPKGYKFT